MELRPIFRTLWRHRVAFAAVALLATVLAVFAGYRPEGGALVARTTPSGAATAQILVDSPSSALANLKQNPIPLSTRAGVFAQFMASTAVRDEIAAETKLQAASILAQGPFDDPAMAPSGKTGPTPPDPGSVARGKRYRLTFVAQEQLPVITVYAQAPDVSTAQTLADSVAPAVQRYVDRLQAEADLDARFRTQIRSLGPAQAGTVTSSPLVKVFALFLLVLFVGGGTIFAVDQVGRRRSRPRSGDDAGAAPLENAGDEPDFVPDRPRKIAA